MYHLQPEAGYSYSLRPLWFVFLRIQFCMCTSLNLVKNADDTWIPSTFDCRTPQSHAAGDELDDGLSRRLKGIKCWSLSGHYLPLALPPFTYYLPFTWLCPLSSPVWLLPLVWIRFLVPLALDTIGTTSDKHLAELIAWCQAVDLSLIHGACRWCQWPSS
jgi:hypothetical protein